MRVILSLLVVLQLATNAQAATENVILVTIDGLRWQEVFAGADQRLITRESGVKDAAATKKSFWREKAVERRNLLMPFLWKTIVKKGQLIGDPSVGAHAKTTNGLHFSYPGYNEILSGRADPRVVSNAKINNPNVTVLEWLNRRAGFRGRVGAFASWDVFPYIINQKRSGIYVNAGWQELKFFRNKSALKAFNELTESLPRYWPNVRYDAFTFRGALEYMHVKKPRVLYVALGETDDWAHSNRYDLYLDAAQRNDLYIERLWKAAQELPQYKGRTTLIITTDHGRGDGRVGWKSHGVTYAGSDRIWIAVMGPDTPARGIRTKVSVKQNQIAATVTELLGQPRPPKAAKPLPVFGMTHGPFVGHVTENSAKIWLRTSARKPLTLLAKSASGHQRQVTVSAAHANDGCVTFDFSKLKAATKYQYQLVQEGKQLLRGSDFHFTTSSRTSDSVALAFGSCAREDAGSATVWRQMQRENPDAVVLLGDTPYIDSTRLAFQRRRYREFFAPAAFAKLVRNRSFYATWDDHDFGRNDTNGQLPGKERSRRAFAEFHANPSFGDGKRGIYTSFRRGPVEVFLLDTRYFAATEPSPFQPKRPSLLGAKQWRWLMKGLRESKATFKVLACGMIWNSAVRPGKQDHWGTYPYERQALMKFIGRAKVNGVVLVGGDIHRTRIVEHPTKASAGYAVPEFITSPVHSGVVETANKPHPGLVFDAGAPNSFLLLNGTTKELTARFINGKGKTLYKRAYKVNQLKAAKR